MAPELFSLSSQEDTVIQNAISIECPTRCIDLWPLLRRQHSESSYEYQHNHWYAGSRKHPQSEKYDDLVCPEVDH
ncbi:hypothetical protein AMTR_s00139p00021080 [Amborella trichopoda]|uniref:Uncharacterized protein n=1 Tax=Amborella trichopoda TaxID=13333 RepID=W1NEN9_AMBTC|nr:hypothetical protein AMTR_s00139p00021080 [Amborella trichopoda]